MSIPETFEQCYQFLKEQLPLVQQQDFFKTPKKDIIKYHHTLGQWMRNNWKLWGEEIHPLKQSLLDLKVYHPDEMSTYIMKYCWDRFQEDEAKVDKEEVRIGTKPW